VEKQQIPILSGLEPTKALMQKKPITNIFVRDQKMIYKIRIKNIFISYSRPQEF
jgi:hypothetical protein